jgi:hypothetical protein
MGSWNKGTGSQGLGIGQDRIGLVFSRIRI